MARRKRIIHNRIQCKKCNQVIESKYRHEFVLCKCGTVGIDGGLDYIRRIGNRNDYIELSIFLELK